MHKPFKKIALTKNRHKPAAPVSPAPAADDELFALAMHGATPLHGKGRAVVPAAPPVPLSRESKKNRTFSEMLSQTVEFDLESTHEYLQGTVKGLDQKIFRKLKAGGFSLEAHLDLHGYHADPARLALLDFIKEHYEQGRRCVLIIPGRGKNSPLGMGILRQGVLTWLTQDPLQRIVLAFCTAQPRHGGAGAVYVLLRNNKKGRGKIVWDTESCRRREAGDGETGDGRREAGRREGHLPAKHAKDAKKS